MNENNLYNISYKQTPPKSSVNRDIMANIAHLYHRMAAILENGRHCSHVNIWRGFYIYIVLDYLEVCIYQIW